MRLPIYLEREAATLHRFLQFYRPALTQKHNQEEVIIPLMFLIYQKEQIRKLEVAMDNLEYISQHEGEVVDEEEEIEE